MSETAYKDQPLLSVCLSTYNFAPYVGQAIEGILMQETDFPIEIIVHDDYSTDGTADIIRDYQAQYPHLISAILQTENQSSQRGKKKGYHIAFEQTQGRYTAYLDGDDYWTDPHKLQKQVDFLEEHPGFSMCGHWVENVDAQGNLLGEPVYTGTRTSEVFNLEYVVNGTSCHIGSWVCRSEALKKVLRDHHDFFLYTRAADNPLLVGLLLQGQGYCFQEFMGVYRVFAGGHWLLKPTLYKEFDKFLFYYRLPRMLGDRFSELSKKQIKHGDLKMVRAIYRSNVREVISLLRYPGARELMPKSRIPVMAYKFLVYVVNRIFRKISMYLPVPKSAKKNPPSSER